MTDRNRFHLHILPSCPLFRKPWTMFGLMYVLNEHLRINRRRARRK